LIETIFLIALSETTGIRWGVKMGQLTTLDLNNSTLHATDCVSKTGCKNLMGKKFSNKNAIKKIVTSSINDSVSDISLKCLSY
jgi:hypothetical protein